MSVAKERHVERRIPLVLLALWLVAIGVVVFSPTSVGPNDVVLGWDNHLRELGAPRALATFGLWQDIFNAVAFLPIGLIAPLLIPWRGWMRWSVLGALCGGAVELVQAVFLPHRSADWRDALSNAAGILTGYVLFIASKNCRKRASEC